MRLFLDVCNPNGFIINFSKYWSWNCVFTKIICKVDCHNAFTTLFLRHCTDGFALCHAIYDKTFFFFELSSEHYESIPIQFLLSSIMPKFPASVDTLKYSQQCFCCQFSYSIFIFVEDIHWYPKEFVLSYTQLTFISPSAPNKSPKKKMSPRDCVLHGDSATPPS